MTETATEAAAGPGGAETPGLPGSGEACALAGMTYRQVDYENRSGWLRPEGAMAGSGSRRRWPDGELAVARVMGGLMGAGLRPRAAAALARSLAEGRTQLAPGIWLELGPAMSDECALDDHGTCFPDEPSGCGCECHGEARDA